MTVLETPTALPQGMVAVNEFSLKLANVNGTGSASTNSLLMQAIFRLGIPVSGKNIFPSNIQGLPTWYEIRASASGHTARASTYDLVVAMNASTYEQDLAEVSPGGFLLYDSTWPIESRLARPGVHVLGLPLARMCAERYPTARQRVLMKNLATAGAIAALLKIPYELVSGLVDETYARHPQLLEANQGALRMGFDEAAAKLACPLPFHVEPMGSPEGRILFDGNTAVALGAVYAGATVAGWYPITPSTSVMENFSRLCARYREGRLPGSPGDGRRDYLIIQAEDELAALGVAVGAGWAGARGFTSTSGPGLSLMQELLGLAYYTEIPVVVVDVQRAGPSTGMPTRTQQADLFAAAYASHGDTKHVLLFPADPGECFQFTVRAFDLAERFQTPVLLMSDLDIGMNDWEIPELSWDDSYRPDRGRVLDAAQLEALGRFERYGSPDEQGVAARSLPGVSGLGGHLVRGSGHDFRAAYTELPEAYRDVVDRLARKHRAAARAVPEAVVEMRAGATAGVIAAGSSDLAVREALERLPGPTPSYMRVRAFPFGEEVFQFVEAHPRCVVVDQNRDGQLRSLIQLETGAAADRLRSLRAYGGLPLTAQDVLERIGPLLED